MKNPPDFVDSIVREIRKKYDLSDKAHDLNHSRRVMGVAMHLAEKEGADKEVLVAASLTHDLHRLSNKGYVPPEETLAEVRAILKESNFPSDKLEDVLDCVRVHDDYNFSGKNRASTVEQEVIQDADNLDALGAVGVARAFAYGGKHNQPLWERDEESEDDYDPSAESSIITHFHQKLFKLKDSMNTDTAESLAQDRHDFMVKFVKEFKKEWEVSEVENK